MRGKFRFLYADIWFDLTKCKFIVKNSSFKMLVVLSPIFVVDTKTISVYNFVAPLSTLIALNVKWVPCFTKNTSGWQPQGAA